MLKFFLSQSSLYFLIESNDVICSMSMYKQLIWMVLRIYVSNYYSLIVHDWVCQSLYNTAIHLITYLQVMLFVQSVVKNST
jgi:hypothetical protein